jgi:hypothetical protein
MRKMNTSDSSNMECVICLSNLNSEYKLLACCHSFHEECINRWLDSKTSCPLCRKQIDSDVSTTDISNNIMNLINEIHNLCDFKILHRNLNLQQIKFNLVKTKLLFIKNKLVEYNLTRNRGFSDDFLASEIGELITDVNSVFRRDQGRSE